MNHVWDRLAWLSPAKRQLLLTKMKRDSRVIRWMQSAGLPFEPMTVEEMSQEACLDDSIDPGSASPYRFADDCILLTGATGFLGAFLLAEILERTRAKVLCLVRSSTEQDGLARIRRNLESYGLASKCPERRIQPVLGDLSQPMLGLPSTLFERFAKEVDVIFHAGALVKWTYPYKALRATNVLGTVEILRMAARSRVKPVHFISTVGVFASGDSERQVSETDALESSGPLYVGYAQSKWIAEKLVDLAGKRGVPVTIHRPNIGPHSGTGAFNPSDHVSLMLKGCVQLGAAPNLDLRVSGAPVDYVVAAIVHLANRQEASGRVFHLVNKNDLTWNQMCWWFRSQGYQIKIEPFEDWRNLLGKALVRREENALAGLFPMFSTFLLDFARLPAFDATITRSFLVPFGIECPPIDHNLLSVHLNRYKRTGFLPDHFLETDILMHDSRCDATRGSKN